MNGCRKCPAFGKCTVTYRGSACAALRSTYEIDTDPEIDAEDDCEKKLAFLLATSPNLVLAWGCSYEEAARDLIANGVILRNAGKEG